MPDLLVTGTDTGVGKTVIAAALVIALRARGVRAIGFKPAQTGCEEGRESDADLLEHASGETTPLASPLLHLVEALAPAVAADRAGTLVDARDIELRVEQLRRAGYSLVIEGAGGVMVPLVWNAAASAVGPGFSPATASGVGPGFSPAVPAGLKASPTLSVGPGFSPAFPTAACYTVLDLAQRFDLDAIVVGRAGLGTLNHVAMTVAILRSLNIPIGGIVLNGRKAVPDVAEVTNPAALARMLPGVAIVEVPQHSSAVTADVIAAAVPLVNRLL